MRRVWARRIALAAIFVLCGGGAAWAQLVKPGVYPPPKDGFTIFNMMTPRGEAGASDWLATLSYQYGTLESRLAAQPERQDLAVATAGLNARIGARGFGGIDLSFFDRDIALQNGALAIDGDLNDVGIRLTGGYMLRPYLVVGGTVTRLAADGTTRFGAGAPLALDATTMSYTAFATLLYPLGDWKFSLTAGYVYGESHQSYIHNARPEQKAWTHASSTILAALHPLTPRLDAKAALAWNHVFADRPFLANRRIDDDWLMPSLGLVYAVTERTSVTLAGTMFVMNDVYDYDGVSLGLSVRF